MKTVVNVRTATKRIALLLGNGLVLVSLVYIVRKIFSFDLDLSFLSQPTILLSLIFFSFISCGMVYITAYSWKQILAFLSQKKIPFKSVGLLYAKSNLGKYLPGNIMHFVGRNLLGSSLEVSQAHIALSSLLETLFIFLVALGWSLTLSGKEFLDYTQKILHEYLNHPFIFIIVLTSLGIFSVALFIYFKKDLIIQYKERTNSREILKLFLQLLFLYSTFFLVQGMVLSSIIGWSIDVNISTALHIISAFSVAWILGFVVPGAPGGIGIREMALLFMLSDICCSEVLLSAIIVQRLISILGEVLAYLLSEAIVRWRCTHLEE